MGDSDHTEVIRVKPTHQEAAEGTDHWCLGIRPLLNALLTELKCIWVRFVNPQLFLLKSSTVSYSLHHRGNQESYPKPAHKETSRRVRVFLGTRPSMGSCVSRVRVTATSTRYGYLTTAPAKAASPLPFIRPRILCIPRAPQQPHTLYRTG